MVKKIKLLIAFALSAVIIVSGNAVKNTYAANLILTGDINGISVIPLNENLFFINDMLPGETESSSIEIRNTDNYAFSLNVNVTAADSGQQVADILDVLDITVFMDGSEITNFPAKGGNISLGRFIPGQIALLDIQLTMDGTRTSNEYQSCQAELTWVFEAFSENDESVVPPPIPPGPFPAPGPIPEGTPVEIIIDEEPVPLGIIEPEPSEPDEPPDEPGEPDEPSEPDEPGEPEEVIEIPEEEVPLGEIPLPKTGEQPLINYIIYGLAVMCLGSVFLYYLIKKHNRKKGGN